LRFWKPRVKTKKTFTDTPPVEAMRDVDDRRHRAPHSMGVDTGMKRGL
jgi:hypothetical protein